MQEMQKHLSEHVRDLMRKARESAGFRFTATPVASKTKKIPGVVKETVRVSPVRKPKEKTMKIKLSSKSPNTSSHAPTPTVSSKSTRGQAKKGAQPVATPTKSLRNSKSSMKEDILSNSNKREPPAKRRKRSGAAANEDHDIEMALAAMEGSSEETTVKDKWLKLYRDKYQAVDEARFRAIQVCLFLVLFVCVSKI